MGKKRTECDSYKIFRININRAQGFLRIFDRKRKPGQPAGDDKELLLGTVVFSVGALDAFLHHLVLELVPLSQAGSSDLADALKAIAKEDPGLALRVALAPNQSTARKVFTESFEEWLETKSFHGPQAIVKALAFIGRPIAWGDFDSRTGVITTERLKHFTDMRHAVVHRGRKPRVVRATAQECVSLIRDIAATINAEAVRHYH